MTRELQLTEFSLPSKKKLKELNKTEIKDIKNNCILSDFLKMSYNINGCAGLF